MKYLGTEIRWQDRRFVLPMERIKLSEQLGYDAVWCAEGGGNDCLTPLAAVAVHTQRLKLGTRILQVTGRPPMLAARALMTIDHMAGGGRVMAGLGGNRGEKPVAEMRQYVAELRAAFDQIALEKSSEIPILIGATYPRMLRLTGELGDGWMPQAFSPSASFVAPFQSQLDEGFRRAGRSGDDFETWCHVDVIVDDDVAAAMRPCKEYVATYVRGLRPYMEARGYSELADRLEELQAAGRTAEAVDAVPDEYVDESWLVGPLDRIRTRVVPWLESDLTGLIIRNGPQVGPDRSGAPENLEVFRLVAEAAGRA